MFRTWRGRLAGLLARGAAVALLALVAFGAETASAQSAVLVVVMPYGAALRTAPSSDAQIVGAAACGDTVYQQTSSGGWSLVSDPANGGSGWVGDARVANASAPPAFSCAGGYTAVPGDSVATYVDTGCLSLRVSRSESAPFQYCVPNGHIYTVLDGPIDENGDDWFQVTSPDTGPGWTLASHLQPL